MISKRGIRNKHTKFLRRNKNVQKKQAPVCVCVHAFLCVYRNQRVFEAVELRVH